jgi:hypothetical protein
VVYPSDIPAVQSLRGTGSACLRNPRGPASSLPALLWGAPAPRIPNPVHPPHQEEQGGYFWRSIDSTRPRAASSSHLRPHSGCPSRTWPVRAPPIDPHPPPPQVWRATQALHHRPDRVLALDPRPQRSMRRSSPAGEIGSAPAPCHHFRASERLCLDIRRHLIDI